MIPGETTIGTVVSKDNNGLIRDFSIYYGNVASPVVDGNVLHMKEDRYLNMLKTFLETDIGKEYEMPTEEEVKQATIEMLNRETRQKKQKEKKQRGENQESYNPGNEPLQMEQVFENAATEHTTIQPLEAEEIVTIIDEGEDRSEQENAERIPLRRRSSAKGKLAGHKEKKSISLLHLILVLALLFSLIANALQWLVHSGYAQFSFGKTNAGEKTIQSAEIKINEKEYTIPLKDIELEEGETKIIIYGITTKAENGQIQNTAMPLGEYRIAE